MARNKIKNNKNQLHKQVKQLTDFEKQLQQVFINGIIVLDANILLNLYRLNDERCINEWTQILKNVKHRLWFPHNVYLEFMYNHPEVMLSRFPKDENVTQFYQAARDVLSCTSEIEEHLKHLRIHEIQRPFLPSHQKKKLALNRAKTMISVIQDDLLNIIEQDELDHSGLDDLKQFIESLFQYRTGNAPISASELEQIYEEARIRYKNNIPPGFKDVCKQSTRIHNGIKYLNEYGDYLMWRQILDFVKTQKVNSLLFVTNDRKCDWWEISDERSLCLPRRELSEEITNVGQLHCYMMLTGVHFFEYAKVFGLVDKLV